MISAKYYSKIPRKLEIGKISQAGFILRNTGNVPLVINDIKSSCGCTVPEWDKSPVKPEGRNASPGRDKAGRIGIFS